MIRSLRLRPLPAARPAALACALLAAAPASAAVILSAWNGSAGLWSDATRWTPSTAVPNNTASDQFEVAFGGGTATLGEGITIDRLTMTSGTIAGPFDFTVNSAATLTGGNFTGAGTTTLRGPATLGLGSALGLDGGRTLRNDTAFVWTGSSINLNSGNLPGAGTFLNAAGATFTATGANPTWISANYASASDTGADASFRNDGAFLKDGSTASHLTNIGVAFHNTGSVEVRTGTLNLSAGGTHSGTFAGTGTIQFGGGTHSLAPSATITTANATFSGGTVTVGGAYAVSDLSTFSGATVDFNAPTALGAAARFTSGTVNFNSTLSPALPSLTFSGSATANFSANNLDVTTLAMSGGTLNGSGTITVTGPATLGGGSFTGAGTTLFQGPVALTGSLTLDGGRILRNDAATLWTGGAINLNGGSQPGGSTFLNSGDATFTIQGSNTANLTAGYYSSTDSSAQALFRNEGAFLKTDSTPAHVTNVNVPFANTGTVEVRTGTLSLNNGGAHTGTFSGAGTIEFGGGTHTLAPSATITAAHATFSGSTVTVDSTCSVSGLSTFSGATTSFNAPVTLGTSASFTSGTTRFNASLAANLDSLSFSGGTAHLGANDLDTAAFTMTSGTLAGTGTVTVNGATSLANATFTGTGNTILRGPATLTSSLGLDGGRTLRSDTSFVWSGSSINLNAGNLEGAGTFLNPAGATFTAQGGNTYQITASAYSSNDGSAAALFRNEGAFIKTGSTATHTTSVNTTFHNTGSVEVQTGILNLAGGGTHTGTFAGAGAIQFGGGAHTLAPTAAITTTNAVFAGGTVVVDSPCTVSGQTSVQGGTVSFNAPVTLGSSARFSGGTTSFNSTLAPSLSSLSLTAGTVNLGDNNLDTATLAMSGGTVSGTGTLTVSGTTTLDGGVFTGTGTTILHGPVTLSASFGADGGRTLRSDTSLQWTGYSINLNNGNLPGAASFLNSSGATFTIQGANAYQITASTYSSGDTAAAARFTNAGTFTKTGATDTNTTNIHVAFDNSGRVEAQTGTINLAAGGTHTGTFSGAGTLQFGGGTHTLAAGSSVSSANAAFTAGTVSVNGSYNVPGVSSFSGATVDFNAPAALGTATRVTAGTVNFNSTLAASLESLALSAGTLNLGANDLAGTALTLTGGTLAGSGTLTVAGTAGLANCSVTGPGTLRFQGPVALTASVGLDGGRTLRSDGALTWSGGSINLNSGTLAGAGTLLNSTGATLTAQGNGASSLYAGQYSATDSAANALFLNAGTLVKTGSTATHTTTVS